MEILTSQLPSGGFGYTFPSITVKPLGFLKISKYIDNLPSNDPLERYLYDIKLLVEEDEKILDCYVMDLDFLIFYKKLCTVSGDLTFELSIKCPECEKNFKKKISLDKDIKFNQIDPKVMNGAVIELGGNKYNVVVPKVRDFLKVFEVYLKYRKVTDLKLIKTIALIGGFDLDGNQIERDVLDATHSDVTLLLALRDLYYDRLNPIEVFCPNCNKGLKKEERRSIAVSVDALIVDFFREICNNSPIDGTKILFK